VPSAPTQRWRRLVLELDLPASTKTVGLVLSVYVNAMGEGWPSRASLAHGAGVSMSTVVRAIARLELAGLLDVTRYRGRTRTNRYRLVLPLEKNVSQGNGRMSFSDFQRVGITLGITPEKVSPGPVKGVTGDTRTSKELDDLSRARPRARGGKGVTKGGRS